MIASPILTRLPAVAAPIEKTLKKRSQKIKQAKELLKDQFALVVASHQAELATLEKIMNVVRAKAKQADAARQESAESIQEKQQVSFQEDAFVHALFVTPTTVSV